MEKPVIFFVSILLILVLIGVYVGVKVNRPYNEIIDINWSVELPNSYKEVYSTDSGSSFHGDGWRYHIFEYKSEEDIEKFLQWQDDKNIDIESKVEKILDILNVPGEHMPNFDLKYNYYTTTKQDFSTIYLIFFPDIKRLFIIEEIL